MNLPASFDCLYIAKSLQEKESGFRHYDIFIFSYLACLLWLYRKNPLTDWGYFFCGTDHIGPFSTEIANEITRYQEGGIFIRSEDKWTLDESRFKKVSGVLDFELFSERKEYIKTSCTTLELLPKGVICSALLNEPDLSRQPGIGRKNRQLLEKYSQDELYKQFQELHTFFPMAADLRIPSALWLSALYKFAQDNSL